MLLFDIARMALALAVTLGLVGLCVVAFRRFGPETLRRMQGFQTGRTERRLAVIETLVLDPTRRLVLVRCDAEERLLLLGEGQVVPHAGASFSSPTPSPASPEA